jgi:hypothetical protein
MHRRLLKGSNNKYALTARFSMDMVLQLESSKLQSQNARHLASHVARHVALGVELKPEPEK